MKKIVHVATVCVVVCVASVLWSCGADAEKSSTDSTTVETVSDEKKAAIETLESESEKINDEATKLDGKADSLLNSINS